MQSLLLTGLFLILIGFSITRLIAVKIKLANLDDDEIQPKPSPVADAIKDMLAVAGGIYIAIAALTSFLKMNIPPTINIGNLVLDPIAFAAVAVTILYALWPRRIYSNKP